VNHVFHVCLIAEFRYRVQQAMRFQGLALDPAWEQVAADDRIRAAWTGELLQKEPWDHTTWFCLWTARVLLRLRRRLSCTLIGICSNLIRLSRAEL